MNDRKNKILTLISEIHKHLSVLAKVDAFYQDYLAKTASAADRSTEQAIVVADVFGNFYTCLESIFLRISQFFENTLARDKWHQDLLHKMMLQIPGIRERVIQDETATLLAEFLKFRHFKRYYFELNYDWDRIQYLQKKYAQVKPMITRDLEQFVSFLRQLAEG